MPLKNVKQLSLMLTIISSFNFRSCYVDSQIYGMKINPEREIH
jgi:hypothetical protein